MEVFIVEVNSVYQAYEMDYDTKAYSTEEKAKAAFKKLVDDDKEIANRDKWTIESDDDDYYLAYEEGDYVENHTEIAVRCLEVA